MTMPRLSVLDLSPVPSGSTPARALHNTIDLARHVDDLGFHRYWLAEHHNAASIASSAPEIMIAAIGAHTKRVHVGSGGIMLPNHSSLKVAETFRALHALYPGRVDLGLGRAPGTDNKTALALRRSPALLGADGFPEQLDELLHLLRHDPDPNERFGPLKAVPTQVAPPELFLLASSAETGAFAGKRGLGFAFAHHFSPDEAVSAVRRYRDAFEPSAFHPTPSALLAVAVVCGETDAHARELARSSELSWVRFGQGLRDLPLPSVEEAKAYVPDEAEIPFIEMQRGRGFVGEPERVAARLAELAAEAEVSELMVTTTIHDHDERKRSYERLHRAFELARSG